LRSFILLFKSFYSILYVGKGNKQAVYPSFKSTKDKKHLKCFILGLGGGAMVSTYECISLMIAFAILIIEIIKINDNKK